MSILRELNAIVDLLAAKGAVVGRFLGPGLDEESIREQMVGLLDLPADLVSFFKWRDGTVAPSDTPLGQMCIMPGWIFMPLAEAVTAYRSGVRDGLWPEGYFPVFTSGVEDYLLFDCTGETGGYLFFRDEPELDKMFLSPLKMLETTRACFEKDVYRIVEDGMIDYDLRAEAEVAAALNPGVEHWLREL